MPLVACPACTRTISDAATSCPNCGHPQALPSPAGTRGIAGAAGPEQTLWQGSPSAKALLGAIIVTALYALVVPVAVHFGYPFLRGLIGAVSADLRRSLLRHHDTVMLVLWGAVALLVAWRVVKLVWRLAVLKTHNYRVSNQRIIVETGVFSKRIEEIDMRVVEDFKLEQTFLERLLGIGDIVIVSSDRTSAQQTMWGLPEPREIRELIRASAYQATRGQIFTRDV